MKDLWGWSSIPGRRKNEGVPLCRPNPLSICLSIYRSPLLSFSLSLFSRSFSFAPSSTPSDAFCSADQRDFCLKHDLSLKYLKPDYLWVCHLGRRDVTPAGQLQDPPLLFYSSFSPRATRLCRWNPTPLNSLHQRETRSSSLSFFLPFSSFYPPSDLFHQRGASPLFPSSATKFDTFPL